MKRLVIITTILFILLLFIFAPLRYIYAPFRYRSLVKEYASRYNLDWLLVASIIYHESRFRAKAVSPKGAIGLMQIMPGTAVEAATRLGWGEISRKELFNPKVNLELGCYYFHSILREFNNEPRIALAAYNAGKGSVYKWRSRRQGGLSYPGNHGLKYAHIENEVYPQTRHYVKNVYCTYRLLKAMDKIWLI